MKRGFTLIELLVVIAIIAILAAILFPVFARAKEAAKKTACLSNVKQISMAAFLYMVDSDDRIPSDAGARVDGSGDPILDGDWGKDFWMFHFSAYLGKPNDPKVAGPSNMLSCPSNPAKHTISEDDIAPPPDGYNLVANGQLAAWGLSPDPDGKYRYYASYAINEHLTDMENPLLEGPNMGMWESPSSNYFFVEANKSEMEGDELIDAHQISPIKDFVQEQWIGLQFPHTKGLNIAYLDGHARYRRIVYTGADIANGIPVGGTRNNSHFRFPEGARRRSHLNDCGGWTAPQSDDGLTPCPNASS